MIDVEEKVFAKVYAALREEYPTATDLDIQSEYVKSPASLPQVSIIESDNYHSYNTEDQSGTENYSVITYDVNVYTNEMANKKAIARHIADIVDKVMYSLNFQRIQMRPTQNMLDATIYRITARYRAVVSADETLYRR